MVPFTLEENSVNMRFAVVAVAFALAGCGGGSTSAESSDKPATPATSSAAVTSTQAAPARGEKPSREFVVGKWGTDGDCVLAIDLRADGTSDGPFGNWSYGDGVISFPDAPELTVNVTVVDDVTMESRNDNGKTTKMTRCP
jgi:hypothetical protein